MANKSFFRFLKKKQKSVCFEKFKVIENSNSDLKGRFVYILAFGF